MKDALLVRPDPYALEYNLIRIYGCGHTSVIFAYSVRVGIIHDGIYI